MIHNCVKCGKVAIQKSFKFRPDNLNIKLEVCRSSGVYFCDVHTKLLYSFRDGLMNRLLPSIKELDAISSKIKRLNSLEKRAAIQISLDRTDILTYEHLSEFGLEFPLDANKIGDIGKDLEALRLYLELKVADEADTLDWSLIQALILGALHKKGIKDPRLAAIEYNRLTLTAELTDSL